MVKYPREGLYHACVYGILALIGLVCLFPMVYVVLVSVTPYQEYLRQGGIVMIPREITLEAYVQFWKEPYMAECFMNTVLVTLLGTAGNMALTVLMAYPLARRDLIGGRFFTLFCMVPLLITGGIVPTYLIVKSTGLIDSLFSLILPTLVMPYILMITRTFFVSIDAGLPESARMDGASEMRILVSIILPVSTPILATIGLMYGVQHWNEYFSSLMYISSSGKRTIQVVLREMLNRANKMEADVVVPTRTLQMAGVVITAVPVICVYPFLQRYFTQGIMLGAIKG